MYLCYSCIWHLSSFLLAYASLIILNVASPPSLSSMPPLAPSPSHPLVPLLHPHCPSFFPFLMYWFVVLRVAHKYARASVFVQLNLCIVLLLFPRACQRAVVCPEHRACQHACLSASDRGMHAYSVVAGTRVILLTHWCGPSACMVARDHVTRTHIV